VEFAPIVVVTLFVPDATAAYLTLFAPGEPSSMFSSVSAWFSCSSSTPAVLVSPPDVTVIATAHMLVVLFVRVTSTDCAPVGTLDAKNHAVVRIGSVAVSAADPDGTAVKDTPPYVTAVACSVAVFTAPIPVNVKTSTPFGVPTGVCVQENEASLADDDPLACEADEASWAIAI
jgi:hypothetical protein